MVALLPRGAWGTQLVLHCRAAESARQTRKRKEHSACHSAISSFLETVGVPFQGSALELASILEVFRQEQRQCAIAVQTVVQTTVQTTGQTTVQTTVMM